MKYDWNKVYDLLERMTNALLADHGAHNEAARRTKLELLKKEIQHARHTGVYVLGSSMPKVLAGSQPSPPRNLDPATMTEFKADLDKFARTYNFFSGVDMSVYVCKDKEIQPLGNVQGISVAKSPFTGVPGTKDFPWGGSMLMLLLDHTVIKVGDNFNFMALQAINEYGHCMWMGLQSVEVVGYDTGIGIDDITTDEKLEYGAQLYTGWLEGLAVRREDRGPLMLTDVAEEALGLKGMQHGIQILGGWRERWEQIKEESRRKAEEEEPGDHVRGHIPEAEPPASEDS